MRARRILVRLPNWLGDLLMSRPLLHALRAALPEARVAATGTTASQLLERERLWDAWEAWPPDPRDSPGLRHQEYDVALALPPSFSSAWRLPRRAGTRIGFASDLRSWLLTEALRRPPRGELHQSEEYLLLGKSLGVEPGTLPILEPLDREREEAGARLRQLEVGGRPYVVLGPGAAYGPAKRWSAERFIELGRRLAARGFAVLACGAEEDRVITMPMVAAIGSPAHSLAGQTSLGEQLALCAGASATVSNDSGLAHLAAASGAPTIALFGSTSSAWTAPLGPRVTVVQHAPVCSPCFQRTCRIGYRCLNAIAVERVERALQTVAA
jgi:heptosyltransferase-2